jgi:PAS domain S-box-containing protein
MCTSAPFPDEVKLAFGTQLQARLIELAYDAIIVRDPASIIVSWNRGAEQLYGWTAQEAIGKVTHELLQTRFPKSREALDRFLVTGEQWEGELVHTRKDGTQVIVESRQVVTRNSQNRPLAILEINRDITERKQRERESQAQYRQLAALVESSDIPIIGKTREGIITSWNRAAERTYGYSAEEAVGQPITLIFPPDRQDEFSRIMEQITRGERVDLYETARRRKDGTILPALSPFLLFTIAKARSSAPPTSHTTSPNASESKHKSIFSQRLVNC